MSPDVGLMHDIYVPYVFCTNGEKVFNQVARLL